MKGYGLAVLVGLIVLASMAAVAVLAWSYSGNDYPSVSTVESGLRRELKLDRDLLCVDKGGGRFSCAFPPSDDNSARLDIECDSETCVATGKNAAIGFRVEP